MSLLVEQGTYQFNKVIFNLQKASLLKYSSDKASHLKAEKIFKEIADKETTFVEHKFYALVNLCDLYLIKLKKTGNLSELDKIQPYIDEAYNGTITPKEALDKAEEDVNKVLKS